MKEEIVDICNCFGDFHHVTNIQGVYDDTNLWSTFRGMLYIVKYIYEWTNAFNMAHYKDSIKGLNIAPVVYDYNRGFAVDSEARKYFYALRHGDPFAEFRDASDDDGNQVGYPNLAVYGKYSSYNDWKESDEYRRLEAELLHNSFEPLPRPIKFPKPTGIKINMMPFVMRWGFESTKLPEYLRGYDMLLQRVAFYCQKDCGKICYLTIDESFVDEGHSQRRPGLHIESPGMIAVNGGYEEAECVAWGGLGSDDGGRTGGIYMCSNMDRTCEIWNCKIEGHGAIGTLGDMEHLRNTFTGHGVRRLYTEANRMYWITDRTPHESLPVEKSGVRQFFRIVTSKLSVWYSQHSTPNPLGVKPDPNITKIIHQSKF